MPQHLKLQDLRFNYLAGSMQSPDASRLFAAQLLHAQSVSLPHLFLCLERNRIKIFLEKMACVTNFELSCVTGFQARV